MVISTRSWVLRLWIGALVAMSVLDLQQVEGDDKYYVKVRNELPRTLTVHCKSGDKDQGIHDVAPAQEYIFKFYLNFFGTTEYWCRFVDGQRWNSFGVWTPPGIWHRHVPCWKCLWVARVDGFWRAEDGTTPSLSLEQPWRQDRNWYPPSPPPPKNFH